MSEMTPEEIQINRIIDERLESVNQELLACRLALAKVIAWNYSNLGKYAVEELLDELGVISDEVLSGPKKRVV